VQSDWLPPASNSSFAVLNLCVGLCSGAKHACFAGHLYLFCADLVAQAARAGEEGEVDASMALTQQADNLGKQHEVLFKQLTEPERTMTVCDICGVFINSTDNEQRRMVSGLPPMGWRVTALCACVGWTGHTLQGVCRVTVHGVCCCQCVLAVWMVRYVVFLHP
jgi:hypothetical protein